jgi:hypothetical protein
MIRDILINLLYELKVTFANGNCAKWPIKSHNTTKKASIE